MKLRERAANLLQRTANVLTNSARNSVSGNLAQDFWRYGNGSVLNPDWSRLLMTDQDAYTGYLFGAINKRANKVAELMAGSVYTDALQSIMDAAKAKKETIQHPYLELIDKSDDFTNVQFAYNISTYLDLEGIFYLMAVRTVGQSKVGDIQYFKLLNPYNVTRVVNQTDGELGGYVERRDGLIREIPKEMIIPIYRLNPFKPNEPYSLVDAAKESQFTLKQAGDYTRHSLKANMAAPGIISTDKQLAPERFAEFVARLRTHEKGEPLYGNGSGSLDWKSMQIEMDKAALDKITNISLEGIIAVTGASKTMLGIEQSGITRETGKVQRDNFTTDEGMPQLRLILDALNQDYKRYYKPEYEKNQYRLCIDNPLGSDRDAESKDVDIRQASFDLYDGLIGKGYKSELAAKYAAGEITLEELGEPTEEPREPVAVSPDPSGDQEGDDNDPQDGSQPVSAGQSHGHEHIEAVRNEFTADDQATIAAQQSSLQNGVINLEERLVSAVLGKVTKNQYDSESDLINKTDKAEFEKELEFLLITFYTAIMPLYAATIMGRRAKEFTAFAAFSMDRQIQTYIRLTAREASQSHINTILGDLLQTSQKALERFVEDQASIIAAQPGQTPETALKEARRKALAGDGVDEIARAIRKEYNESISKSRATAVARTETNRAFTRSQYEADRQFIDQNGLKGRAYKKWITRSSNPCPLCLSKAKEAPIPFDQAFAELGDTLEATYEEGGKTKVKKQLVTFETIQAGNAHVNCSCSYILIIQ